MKEYGTILDERTIDSQYCCLSEYGEGRNIIYVIEILTVDKQTVLSAIPFGADIGRARTYFKNL